MKVFGLKLRSVRLYLKNSLAYLKVLIVLLMLSLVLVDGVNASNVLIVSNEQTNPNGTVTVHVDVENTDAFTGLQMDFVLDGQLSFVPGSGQLNPDRQFDHIISVAQLPENTIRVFIFSLGNSNFLGNSGTIFTFDLLAGSEAGVYPLIPENSVLGNIQGENILTGVVNGSVTILGTNIGLSDDELDFGNVPLGESEDRVLIISNNGSIELFVTNLTFTSGLFSVVGSTSFGIGPGENQDVTIRFQAQIAGQFSETMTIHSSDPHHPTLEVGLLANSFVINELHCGSMMAFSGEQGTLSLSINNMQTFSGFRFDLTLPESLNFVDGSAVLSGRKTDHIVTAEMIDLDILRVEAYSPRQDEFLGNEGIVVTISFNIYGPSGIYPLSLSNVFITDIFDENIVTAFYDGQVEILAPEIVVPDTLEFGQVLIVDTAMQSLTIYNNGLANLIVNDLTFTNTSFWSSQELPFLVEPESFYELEVYFHHPTPGNYNGVLNVFSNDPVNNQISIDLGAQSVFPNMLYMQEMESCPNDTITVLMYVDNYLPFSALSFTLQLPDGLAFYDDPAFSYLTDRADDHLLEFEMMQPDQIHIVASSATQSYFSGDSGAVVAIGILVNSTIGDVVLDIGLSDVFLDNGEGQNIIDDWQGASINLLTYINVNCPEYIELCIDHEPLLLDMVTPQGGIYYGEGISGNYFSPEIAGPGMHHIDYVVESDQGCFFACHFIIEVFSLPEVNCSGDLAVCLNQEPFELDMATPSGGVYSGTGVVGDNFMPEIAGIGSHQIIYTYTDDAGCTSSCTFSIVVNELPEMFCPENIQVFLSDDPLALSGAEPEGGFYSGNGVSQNIFNPEGAGIGSHTITYTITDDCGVSTCTFLIHVEDDPVSTITGDANCDETVDILDVVTVINSILEYDPEPFCASNADANDDGIIDILDAVSIINLILNTE